MSSHVIIAGPGRSGTSFLVGLLTRLGMNTGLTPNLIPHIRSPVSAYDTRVRAGFECDIRNPDAPRVVKDPYLSLRLREYVAEGKRITHALVPVRDFSKSSGSRKGVKLPTVNIPWPHLQDEVGATVMDAAILGFLVQALVELEIPTYFLAFPAFVKDARYCQKALAGFGSWSAADFAHAHRTTSEILGFTPATTPQEGGEA